MSDRVEKVANRVKELSAEFLSRVADRSSLINVTRANCSPDLKRATVFITVLPIEREAAALGFALRQRGELREYLKKNLSTKNVPFVDIEIDQGEKNRQKIDDLLRNG